MQGIGDGNMNGGSECLQREMEGNGRMKGGVLGWSGGIDEQREVRVSLVNLGGSMVNFILACFTSAALVVC